MESRDATRLVIPLMMLAVAVVGLVAVRVCACVTPPASAGDTEWREHLQAADAALAEQSVSRAVRVWHEAHGAAVRSGAWDALVAVGDASLRIGELAAAGDGAKAQARGLYLRALFQARAQASLDGVLRATEAFANLGDADVVEQGLRVARQLAASQGPAAWDRVREATIRLGARHSMAEGIATAL